MPFLLTLNGDWDLCPLPEPNPPVSLPENFAWEDIPFHVPSSWRWVMDPRFDFQPYDLLHYPRHWNDYPAAFLRRQETLDEMFDERILLKFEGVLQRWMCFVNGQAISPQPPDGDNQGVMVESFLPVIFDVTDVLHPGINEIIIWTGAWERMDTPAGPKLTNPNGSWFADLSRGIWQDVTLFTRPLVSIIDAAVRTSTRLGRISVEITVQNTSRYPVRSIIAAEVYDHAISVFSFDPLAVSLAPGQDQVFVLHKDWQNARCWSPDDPHLYDLTATLTLQQSIPAVQEANDKFSIRFGFREVWFEGHIFYLNGIRINLRGDAWHYQGFSYQTPQYARNWYALVKSTGMNFVRLHAQPYPQFFLDIADEMGMLIVDESAIYGSSKSTQSDHPLFLENCRGHLERLVRRDRNHPSVILWSMQNEMRWVDGRDGYRDAMPALTTGIRVLDPTRAIVYDGDKRLVPPEWCDALSLHYNIDGTVDDWAVGDETSVEGERKRLPLLFGEHGAFHYVSPQVSADLGGQRAYLHFEDAIASIGESERLFIEYARGREVTGLTPFNMVYYTHWTLPPHHLASLPNDGAAEPRPNPAYAPLAQACARVLIAPNELNTVFYSGEVRRSFNVFNDTEARASARLEWFVESNGQVVGQGQWDFEHLPGEFVKFEKSFIFSNGSTTLSLRLYHQERLVYQRSFAYRIYDRSDLQDRLAENFLGLPPLSIAYFGANDQDHLILSLLPGITLLAEISLATLRGVRLLVLGERLRMKAETIAPLLDTFVREGGALLVLEQDQLTFGELKLSGRKFFAAHPNPVDHPVFNGLSGADLRFWTPDNPHADEWRGLVRNAFLKPVDGNLEILLECAEGSFGWGGLLWTALVSYRLGQGKAIFCQVAMNEFLASVPQAAILLNNLLFWLSAPTLSQTPTIQRVEAFSPEMIERARAGEMLLVRPLVPADAPLLRELLGPEGNIIEADTYQLALTDIPSDQQPFAGVSAHDLFHIERVTYTPRTYQNRLIAQYAIKIPGAVTLLQDVLNPWRDFFINGMDGEWLKMAVATQCHDCASSFEPRTYAARLSLGKGALIFCQILPETENPKVRRIYNRLLANLSSVIDCNLFTYFAPASERGIPAFMGLAHQPHQDEEAMRAYFSSPEYALNNLGEGVYGWMLRLEQQDDVISIPNSAGQTWFLTVFVDSEINRDPTRREGGLLPDRSIVPDLWIEANSPVTVILNGQILRENANPVVGGLNVGDALLQKGINRLVVIARIGTNDFKFRAWLLSKFGEPVSGIKTMLTQF
jgi:hypothetical protein